jgi:hypothetical protein
MGHPTSSYATAGIALRVSGALKPHHHDKLETSSLGLIPYTPVEVNVLIQARSREQFIHRVLTQNTKLLNKEVALEL